MELRDYKTDEDSVVELIAYRYDKDKVTMSTTHKLKTCGLVMNN